MNLRRNQESLRKRWLHMRIALSQTGRRFGSMLKYPIRILFWPIKLMFSPIQLLTLFHDVGVRVDHSGRQSRVSRRNTMIRVISQFLFFPARIIRSAFRIEKRKELLFLLPLLTILGLSGFVAYRLHFRASEIENRYLVGAQRAINNGDFGLAKSYFGRVLSKDRLSDRNTLAWAVILANSGEERRSEQLLDQIAPDDQIGYAPAHATKAINTYFRLEQSKQQVPDLERLHWHLENSGPPTAELSRAWEAYYLARKQTQRASECSKQPVVEWPEVHVLIANILANEGTSKEATQLLNQFAPDDQSGYPPAHAVKAIRLAQVYEQSIEIRPSLDVFYWHLKNSGDPNAMLSRAWASYFMACEQPQEAIGYLYQAVEEFPEVYLQIADISERNGLKEEYDRALAKAKSKFSRQIRENPLDFDSRVWLVTVLVKLKEYFLAESTLLAGLKLYPSPGLKHAASVFYVSQYNRSPESNLDEKLRLLKRAIQADVEEPLPFLTLVDLMSASSFELSNLKAQMELIITGNYTEALDHCIFARVLAIKGQPDEALWHLDQAWLLDQARLPDAEFGVLANHLAEAFASHRTTPDLDWALQLARKTVKHAPNEPAFRETLGSILARQKKYEEAIAELEMALSLGGNPLRLHTMLAVAYDEMENESQALIHARAASTVLVASEQELATINK